MIYAPKYAVTPWGKYKFDYNPKWFALGGPPSEPIHYAIHAYEALQSFLHPVIQKQYKAKKMYNPNIPARSRFYNAVSTTKARYRFGRTRRSRWRRKNYRPRYWY